MHRWLVSLLLACAPLLAQDGEDPAFSVSGQVVTTAGRACEGASVQLWDALASDRPLARTLADKEGNFELVVTRDAIARREHPFGPVRIEAYLSGRARVGGRVAPGTRKLRIVLPKPQKWTGVVRDPEGVPLPGAPVRAEQGEMRYATTTDENGAYAFTDMGSGRIDLGQSTVIQHPTMIYLRASGHALRRIGAAAGEPVDLQLQKAPIGKGRVLDEVTFKPVSGVRLVALHGSSPVEAVTDKEGRFELEVEDKFGRVAAYRDGYAATPLHVYPSKGEEDHLMAPAETVSGTVVDEEGSPIPFASVELDPGFGDAIRARCDAAGAFGFPVGVLGFARVTATRLGYLPGRSTVDAHWRPGRVQVELKRGREVTGTVKRDGTEVMGAEIVFRGLVPPGEWREYERAYSDGSGVYRARAVPPEATHVFARLGKARSELVPIDDGVDFEIAEVVPVRGTIVDDEGRPLEGVLVGVGKTAGISSDAEGRFVIPDVPVGRADLLVRWPEKHVGKIPAVVAGDSVTLVANRVRGPLTLSVGCAAPRSGYTEVVVRTANMARRKWLNDGADDVDFRDLGPGKYVVEIGAAGYIPYEGEVELTAAGPNKFSAELERAGTLILTATKGARLVVQTLEGQPSPVVSQRLDAERTVVGGFGPGRYRFIARAQGEIIVMREVTVGAKDAAREIDLVGGAASTLTVTVKNADGTPLEGASIDLVTPGGFTYRTSQRTDAAGKATISRLILGPLRVVARSGENRIDKGIRIEAGSEQSIVLELR